jgi:hypothetical protein
MIPNRDILKNLSENFIKKSNKDFIFDNNPIKPQDSRVSGWSLLKEGYYTKKFDFFSKDFLCDFGKEVFDYMNDNVMIDFNLSTRRDQMYVILGSKEMVTGTELKIARDLNEIYENLLEKYKKGKT